MAVVFTDSFTVAANVGIAAYPAASPNNDYAYMRGSGTNLQVNAANDRVQSPNTADEYHARMVDATVASLAVCEITATVYSADDGSQNSGELLLRCSSSADTCYIAYVNHANTNEVEIYRCVAGSLTLIASADRGLTGSAARTWVFRAEGTGATVTLTLTIAGGTPLTYNDTSGSRLTSGGPGIGIYNGTANVCYVDNISVDDLVAGGVSVTPTATSLTLAQVAPTVVAGSLSLSPAATQAALSVVAPTVALGGNLTVAPTATSITLAQVAPTVQLGALTLAPAATALRLLNVAPTVLPNAVVGLSFFGSDPATYPDVDRMRIPLRSSGSPTAADVGASDFSYEFWFRCLYADNTSTRIDDWRYSNIIFDRDAWNSPRGHGIGVAQRDATRLVLLFGVAGPSLTHVTIAGTSNVGDGAWHHGMVRRNATTGLIELVVDNTVEASGTYTTGTLAYDDSNAGGQDNDQIIVGREKHDVGVGWRGDIDVIRVSTVRRTGAAERPLAVDASTAVMYRLNEATGTSAADASGNGVTATLMRGGPSNGPAWLVETGVGTLVSPAASTLTVTQVAPTVAIGSPPITPTASSLTLAQVAPTVVAGSLSIAAAATQLTMQQVAPGVIAGSLSIGPLASVLTLLQAAPTVTLGALVLSPAAATLTLLQLAPGIIAGSMTLTPAAASLALAQVAPTVQAGGDTALTPAATQLRLITSDPTVQLSSQVLVPAASLLTLLAANPAVQVGALIVGPAATQLRFSVVDPTVVAGSVSLAPGAALLQLGTADPTTVLGAMAVTPGATALQLAVVGPVVTAGNATPHAAVIYRPRAERLIYRPRAERLIYRPRE